MVTIFLLYFYLINSLLRMCLYRDNFMSAQEALTYGLIDEIVSPNDEKLQATHAIPIEDTEDFKFGKIVCSFIHLFLCIFNEKNLIAYISSISNSS